MYTPKVFLLSYLHICMQSGTITNVNRVCLLACFFFPVGRAVNHFHIYNIKKALWAIILVVNKLLLLLKCHGSLLNYWISLPVKTINLVSTTFLWASQSSMFYVRHIRLKVLGFFTAAKVLSLGFLGLISKIMQQRLSLDWVATSWAFLQRAGFFKQMQRYQIQQKQ